MDDEAQNASLLYLDVLPTGLRGFHHASALAASSAALALNGALAALLLTERSATLAAYRCVLLQNCAVDLLLALATLLTEMQFDFLEGRMVFVVNSALRTWPLEWQYVLVGVYITPACASCFVPMILVYFRYMLVSRKYLVANRRLLCILSVILVWALIQGLLISVALWRNHDDRVSACQRLLGDSAVWTRDGFPNCLITQPYDPFLLLYLGFAMLNNAGIYTTMCAGTVAVFRHLRQDASSKRTMRLQRQLNRMLVCQMTVPLFTMVIPVGTMALFPLIGVTVPGWGVVDTILMMFLALVSPLTTILFVGNFRRRLLCWRPARSGSDSNRTTPIKNNNNTNNNTVMDSTITHGMAGAKIAPTRSSTTLTK